MPVCASFFAAASDDIAFTKVKLPGGWLGNMSPHAIVHEGVRWRTSEALFQAMRLEDVEAREAIRQAASPMMAKLIAKRYVGLRVVEALSPKDVENMRLCISLKLAQHELLRRKLWWSRDAMIIEDCSSRGSRGSNLFWGAMRVEGGWEGEHWLGRIWMELRSELKM